MPQANDCSALFNRLFLKLRVSGLTAGAKSFAVVESTDFTGVATLCFCLRVFDVECFKGGLFVLCQWNIVQLKIPHLF